MSKREGELARILFLTPEVVEDRYKSIKELAKSLGYNYSYLRYKLSKLRELNEVYSNRERVRKCIWCKKDYSVRFFKLATFLAKHDKRKYCSLPCYRNYLSIVQKRRIGMYFQCNSNPMEWPNVHFNRKPFWLRNDIVVLCRYKEAKERGVMTPITALAGAMGNTTAYVKGCIKKGMKEEKRQHRLFTYRTPFTLLRRVNEERMGTIWKYIVDMEDEIKRKGEWTAYQAKLDGTWYNTFVEENPLVGMV